MDICPDFITPTSRKRFFGQLSEPVLEPEFGTFRGSKVVFAGSKNDHFLVIFVFFHVPIRNLELSEVVKLYLRIQKMITFCTFLSFSCSDPEFGTFRGSKAVFADSNTWWGDAMHFGPPCPAGAI